MIKKNLLKINFFIGSLNYKIFREKKGNILVLLFHTFIQNKKTLFSNHILNNGYMDVKNFKLIIEFLKNENFIFISKKQIMNSKLLDSNKKYVFITLDDGYFNNFLILDTITEFNIPIYLFVNTYNINNNKKFWWDIVYFYEKKRNMSDEDIYKLINSYQKMPFTEIIKILKQNYGRDCETPLSDLDRPMSNKELMLFSSENLVSIGNHLKYHSTIYSQSEILFLNNLKECQSDIFDLLNFETRSFSYPNGVHSPKYNDLLINQNYNLILTGESKINNIKKFNSNNYRILGRFSFINGFNYIDQLATFSLCADPIYLVKKFFNK